MIDSLRVLTGVISGITNELLQSGVLDSDTANKIEKVRGNCDLINNFLCDKPAGIMQETEPLISEIKESKKQKIVYIVDDNDTVLTMAALVLENDYKVLTIPSAQRMFYLLDKKRPDLIILDIEMPGMNGIDAIVKLKENPDWKEIPVIFLTSHDEEAYLSAAKEKGALDVITKPVAASILLDYAKKYI